VKARALNNLAMQLQKVCNNPFMLPDVETEIVKPGQDPAEAMMIWEKVIPKGQPRARAFPIETQRTHRHRSFEIYDAISSDGDDEPNSQWSPEKRDHVIGYGR
jgi:hypothetical protein